MPKKATSLSLVPSWPESMIGNLTLAHEDPRRAIYESNRGDFSLQLFKINTRCALGNHYHIGKSETFTILEGSGFLVAQAVDASGKACGGIFNTPLNKGSVIRIVPFMVHTFVLEEGTTMLNYSSAPFDPKNMDMTAHTLVDPRTLVVIA